MERKKHSLKALKTFIPWMFILALCTQGVSAFTIKTENILSEDEIAEIAEIAKELKTLVEYEIDGVYFLEKSIEKINNRKLKEWLVTAKEEREAHVKILTKSIKKLPGYKDYAPIYIRDSNNLSMKGYTEMGNFSDDLELLKTLYSNERIILEAYEKALKFDFPKKIKAKVRNIYNHNKQHLAYLHQSIRCRQETGK